MNKTLRILALVGSLLAIPAFAADNALIVTPGVGVTVRSVDIGAGVQAPGHAFVNASGTQIGVAGSEVFVGGRGTAGTATGGVLTVQGVASMTPFLSNPGTAASWGIGATGAAVPANASYMGIISGGNLTGWTGAVTQGGTWTVQPGNTANTTAWLVTGTGGTFPISTWAGGTLGAMATYGTSPGAVNVPGVNAFVTNTLAAGQAVMASSSPVVIASNQSAVPASIDPCNDALTVKSFLPITATTSLVKVIATGTAAKKLYICQIHLATTAANNVAVFEATTATTCATAAVAVYGAGTSVATAANGYPFPANGGISLGNGLGTVGLTTVNNNDLCIGTSAATPLTGGITYATK